MSNIQPQNRAAVKAEIQTDPQHTGYAGQSAAEQCRLLCLPTAVANPTPQSQIPVAANWDAIIAAGQTQFASIDTVGMGEFADAVNSLDYPAARRWLLVAAVKGQISTATQAAISACLTTQPDPAWQATIDGPSRLQIVTDCRSGGICPDELTLILEG